jgi:hypothetical protein
MVPLFVVVDNGPVPSSAHDCLVGAVVVCIDVNDAVL